jgi:large subunit ribosomal protein L10
MNRDQKAVAIDELKEKFEKYSFFYLTDSSTLSVQKINELRSMCFEKGVEMKVVKNTLAWKALAGASADKNYSSLEEALHGPTAILFAETANLPAKIILDFRKDGTKPELKAAYIDSGIYFGDDELKNLKSLKSKDELVGEILGLLQSPIKNVIGALSSGGNKIAGLVKALEERAQ